MRRTKTIKKPSRATVPYEEKYATRKSFFEIVQYMNKLRKLRFLTFIEMAPPRPDPQVEKEAKPISATHRK
jgi:hypothetical protein